jgi:hypothetical protein
MESNPYTRWSKLLSRCPNDRSDDLDKVHNKYMHRLNWWSQNITGWCIGSCNTDKVKKKSAALVEPMVQCTVNY